jgi:hypothetical protein
VSLANPGPIMQVPAGGGVPKPVTTLEPGDNDHDWPEFLDDGVHFLYAVRGAIGAVVDDVTSGDPPSFGPPRRIYAGPLEYPSAHSIDVDPKSDHLIVAPSLAVQGDLTVLVNWESLLAQ